VNSKSWSVPSFTQLHSISIRARAGKSREELAGQARDAVKVICG